MSTGALARAIARTRTPGADQCELCGAPLPSEHQHLLDVAADQPRCVCRACALLFERDGAALGGFRLVPQHRVRLPEQDADTDAPVGLAWYVLQPDGGVQVRYPGPAGATTGALDPRTWAGLVRCWPELGELTPLVEALLVNTALGRREHWIVPITDCYALIARIRGHWRGLSGGPDVWPAVDAFFARLGTAAVPGKEQ